MKLPRDIGGEELAKLLVKYGYHITRQTGSHMRLSTSYKGNEHHITIPNNEPLRTGTLNSIINGVAVYLKIEKQTLIDRLFE
jgi:predicted RNA binding protein YcfA (HicA-like mRNA interferase family)